jgi:hypothetical protein
MHNAQCTARNEKVTLKKKGPVQDLSFTFHSLAYTGMREVKIYLQECLSASELYNIVRVNDAVNMDDAPDCMRVYKKF